MGNRPSTAPANVENISGSADDILNSQMPQDMEQSNDLSIPGLKERYPKCTKVVKASNYPEIVDSARSAIANDKGREPKPGDMTSYIDKIYDPTSGKIEATEYAYGVSTKGQHILLKGKTIVRNATSAEMVDSKANPEQYALENIKKTKKIPSKKTNNIISKIANKEIPGQVFFAVRQNGRNYGFIGSDFV